MEVGKNIRTIFCCFVDQSS